MDRRRLLISQRQSELPQGYTRVEYLYNNYSTANTHAYLSIPNYITIDSKISIECIMMNITNAFLFGVAHRTYTSGCQLKPQNKKLEGRWGNAGWTSYVPFSTNLKTKIIFENGKITVNGDAYEFARNTTNVESNTPIYVFARNLENTVNDALGGIKLYSFSIDNSINLIPCLDPNNRPCMYDTVSKTPFYNQGSGEFLYG